MRPAPQQWRGKRGKGGKRRSPVFVVALAGVALTLAVVFWIGGGLFGSRAPGDTLVIVSGSENRSLEPIVTAFCQSRNWQCEMRYQGSVDIMLALEAGDTDFDAVWPAHSRWVDLGDSARRVSHLTSIMQSPVAWGVQRSRAEELGLIDADVSSRDLVDIVSRGDLDFIMTSATQSNSGFSAYVAMLTALAGNPEVLTDDTLGDPALRADLQTLLHGVTRTAGSSGWLADLYLEGAADGAYNALVNYEALFIETNQELARRGLEPLYAVYPVDGTAVADSPLGFVDNGDGPNGNAHREAFFLELQQHLLSEPVQQELLAFGRRTGFGGVIEDAPAEVFRDDWGLDPSEVLAAIRFPTPEVIREALALYQQTLRKPSLLAMCLDFSGSMEGEGETDLKAAIDWLFDPDTAARYMLQPTAEDVFIIIPFDSRPRGIGRAQGPEQAEQLAAEIQDLHAGGGTDMYACAQTAFNELRRGPELATHNPAVLLLTDGESDETNRAAFETFYRGDGQDIPIYAITFGRADESQLSEIAAMSRARVFDGREDLIGAFRSARGYN